MASCELMDGQLMPCFEMPSRADHVPQRVKERELGPVQAPQDFGLAPLQSIHSREYLDFFKGARQRWTEYGQDGDSLPYTWPARTLSRVLPTSLHGQLGYDSFDGGAPITAGTWQAGLQRSASGPHGAGRHRARRSQCLRPVPPTGASCRQRCDGRLLLPQQRGHRGPGVP